MQKLKTTFKAAAPMRHRRWDRQFTNPKFKPRVRRKWRPRFGYARPKR